MPQSSKERVRKYRERMRAKGLRPVQFWLPDTDSEEFRREAHRQSKLIAESETAKEDMDFVESISEWYQE